MGGQQYAFGMSVVMSACPGEERAPCLSYLPPTKALNEGAAGNRGQILGESRNISRSHLHETPAPFYDSVSCVGGQEEADKCLSAYFSSNCIFPQTTKWYKTKPKYRTKADSIHVKQPPDSSTPLQEALRASRIPEGLEVVGAWVPLL